MSEESEYIKIDSKTGNENTILNYTLGEPEKSEKLTGKDSSKCDDESHKSKKKDSSSHKSKKPSSDSSSDSDGFFCSRDNNWEVVVGIIVLAFVITIIFILLAWSSCDMWMTQYIVSPGYRLFAKALLFFIILILIFFALFSWWCS